jgi:small subunit ribosomal protein S13
MLVIFGVNFNKNKHVVHALPDLYGIGVKTSKDICAKLGLSLALRIEDLTEQQQFEISKLIKENFKVEGNLREEIKNNIQKFISNGSLKGFRHRNKLPVRGQRTQTNAKTAKRVVMGMALKAK